MPEIKICNEKICYYLIMKDVAKTVQNVLKFEDIFISVHVILIGIVGCGVHFGPLGTVAPNGLLCHQPRVIMMLEKYLEKTCPSAALSTTNPTCCTDTNPGRHGGKPVTNRLSYGTTIISSYC
jgi:hypothetical protein